MARRANIIAVIWIELVHRSEVKNGRSAETQVGYFENKKEARGRGRPFGKELVSRNDVHEGFLLHEHVVMVPTLNSKTGFLLESHEPVRLWEHPDISVVMGRVTATM